MAELDPASNSAFIFCFPERLPADQMQLSSNRE
jgi:hypothetical protein